MYLDLIWLLNLLFDTWLLWLTAIVLKRKVRKRRLILGGFLGSLIVIGLFTPYSAMIGHPIFKGFISIGMVLVTFRFHRLRAFGQALMTFYFVTFAVGGGMIGIFHFLQIPSATSGTGFVTYSGGYGHPVSWLFVLLSFPALLYFSKKRLRFAEEVSQTFQGIVDFELHLLGQTLYGKGFIDTGNHLSDPVTKNL
ncbi:sigma-E processing peptidase SpoIIGA [Bacillaceae bacterium SIJ1]|nr:sigma-E processing peptidase SpoIIGA [Litoribacterium kuwaitense]NGP44335.1 sigma-E processing peptidase SpoIIGA [Litoribacterium kuwaitense]